MGWETLHGRICELENGTVVPPGSLLPWLDGADVERATFTPGGQVAIGYTTRLFPGVTGRVTAADRGAGRLPPRHPERDQPQRPGCSPGPPAGPSRCGTGSAPTPSATAPARSAEIDHIQPWALGGPTTQENGRLLCPFHNRLRNQRPPPARRRAEVRVSASALEQMDHQLEGNDHDPHGHQADDIEDPPRQRSFPAAGGPDPDHGQTEHPHDLGQDECGRHLPQVET